MIFQEANFFHRKFLIKFNEQFPKRNIRSSISVKNSYVKQLMFDKTTYAKHITKILIKTKKQQKQEHIQQSNKIVRFIQFTIAYQYRIKRVSYQQFLDLFL